MRFDLTRAQQEIATCTPARTWDTIEAAAGHSQLAGVLAGAALVGLSVLLATPSIRRRKEGLRELLVAFVVLSIAALEWSILAAEIRDPCSPSLRPDVVAVFATATLAVGGLQLVAALCHLVISHLQHDERVSMLPGDTDLAKTSSGTVDAPPAISGELSDNENLSKTFMWAYVLVAMLALYHMSLTFLDPLSKNVAGSESDLHWIAYGPPPMAIPLIFAATVAAIVKFKPLKSFATNVVEGVRLRSIRRTFSYRRLLAVILAISIVAAPIQFSIEDSDSLITAGQFSSGLWFWAFFVAGSLLIAATFVLAVWQVCVLGLDYDEATARPQDEQAVASEPPPPPPSHGPPPVDAAAERATSDFVVSDRVFFNAVVILKGVTLAFGATVLLNILRLGTPLSIEAAPVYLAWLATMVLVTLSFVSQAMGSARDPVRPTTSVIFLTFALAMAEFVTFGLTDPGESSVITTAETASLVGGWLVGIVVSAALAALFVGLMCVQLHSRGRTIANDIRIDLAASCLLAGFALLLRLAMPADGETGTHIWVPTLVVLVVVVVGLATQQSKHVEQGRPARLSRRRA